VSAIERSVAEVGSPAAAKHVATALRGGKPLSNASGTVAVERGKLVVTRDIERLSATPATRAGPIDLSRAEVYVDTRLRVGREGLTPDTGGHVARWARRRDVTIEVMDRSAIGALPDRIVVRSTKTTLERASGTPMLDAVTKVIIVRHVTGGVRCDGSGRTSATSDDCAEQR
jgi:hypothetical protein